MPVNHLVVRPVPNLRFPPGCRLISSLAFFPCSLLAVLVVNHWLCVLCPTIDFLQVADFSKVLLSTRQYVCCLVCGCGNMCRHLLPLVLTSGRLFLSIALLHWLNAPAPMLCDRSCCTAVHLRSAARGRLPDAWTHRQPK